MNRLVLLPSTELVSDLYAVLGCAIAGREKKSRAVSRNLTCQDP